MSRSQAAAAALAWFRKSPAGGAAAAAAVAISGSGVAWLYDWRLVNVPEAYHCFAVGPGGRGSGLAGAWGAPWDHHWDQLDDPRTIRRGRRTVVLVRHGQYIQKRMDSALCLTDLGTEQAKRTGDRLREMVAVGLIPVNQDGGVELVSSDMLRATQTTVCLMQSGFGKMVTNKRVDSRLRECRPCLVSPNLKGAPLSEARMERIELDNSLTEAAFHDVFRRPVGSADETIIVVGHANVFRHWTLRALQLPPEAWCRLSLPHCSVSRFEITPMGTVVLRALGDCGHMPAEEVSTSNA